MSLMVEIHTKILPVFAVFLLLAGCNNNNTTSGDTTNNGVAVTDELRLVLLTSGITGDPTTGRTLPKITDATSQLGMKLFFAKSLGGDNDSACVTCHHPTLGGGDDISLPVGVGAETPALLGPGRFHDVLATHHDGGPTVPRNAPTTFNLGLWDRVMFHDGRIESLGKTPGVNGEDGFGISTPDTGFGNADPTAGRTLSSAQSRFPVTSGEEMRGFVFEAGNGNTAVRTSLEAKLTALGSWGAEFTAAFGDPAITYERIAEALAEYERSQVFVNTPWKAFVEGNTQAISASAQNGARLFFTRIENGGANCVSCHTGDFFTDEKFHVIAVPQIGRGKGDNNGTLANDDFGRFRVTGRAEDMYRFRTPTLLNVEVTGPWGHAGAYTTLEAMVRHSLNPTDAIANYDFSQLDANIQAADMLTNTQFALDQLDANRLAAVPETHRDVIFTDNDVIDLVAFLKTLTDPCVKDRACLAAWIPDVTDSDTDGSRLDAVDNNLAPL